MSTSNAEGTRGKLARFMTGAPAQDVPARADEAPELEYRATPDALVQTEQRPSPMQLDADTIAGIGDALGMVRKQMRDHTDSAVAELKAQATELTRTVEDLRNELTLLRVTKPGTSRQPIGPRTRSTDGAGLNHASRRN